MAWKQWLKPAAGVLLVLPVVSVDFGAISIFAPVTVGVLVGAVLLADHFNVI